MLWIAADFYTGYRETVREAVKPVTAQETKRADKWPEHVETCVPVVVKEVPAKEVKRIERDFGVKLEQGNDVAESGNTAPAITPLSPRVLGLFNVPPMKYGGEVLGTLPQSGELDLTFKPSAPPFVSFRPSWGFGGGFDPLRRTDWTGYVLVEPLHFREKWHVRGTAGLERRGDESGAVLTIGLEFRSR